MVHSVDTGMADNGSSPQSAFSTSAFDAAYPELQLQQPETPSVQCPDVCSQIWSDDRYHEAIL